MIQVSERGKLSLDAWPSSWGQTFLYCLHNDTSCSRSRQHCSYCAIKLLKLVINGSEACVCTNVMQTTCSLTPSPLAVQSPAYHVAVWTKGTIFLVSHLSSTAATNAGDSEAVSAWQQTADRRAATAAAAERRQDREQPGGCMVHSCQPEATA